MSTAKLGDKSPLAITVALPLPTRLCTNDFISTKALKMYHWRVPFEAKRYEGKPSLIIIFKSLLGWLALSERKQKILI